MGAMWRWKHHWSEPTIGAYRLIRRDEQIIDVGEDMLVGEPEPAPYPPGYTYVVFPHPFVSFGRECRPLFDDWAAEIDVTIEWLHTWSKDGTWRCTAFGYDQQGNAHHNTVVQLPAGGRADYPR